MFRKVWCNKLFAIILAIIVFSLNVSATDADKIAVKDNIVTLSKKGYLLNKMTISNLPEYMSNNLKLDKVEADKQAVSIDYSDADELNSFTTVNKDGSKTLYLFNEPVKFIDKITNEIKFIDNSIEEEKSVFPLFSSETNFVNKSNDFILEMPKTLSKGIALNFENFEFKMYPANINKSIGLKKNISFHGETQEVIEYRDVFGEGIHLQYAPLNSGVKENIVLDKYSGINTFEFIVETGEFEPLYMQGESIPFVNPETDEIGFVIGQVDARDSYIGDMTDGHFTIYNFLMVKKITEGKYSLKVTVDSDFLKNENTVYPVVIDPSITIGSSNMLDASVYSAMPNTQTFYTSSYNIVGNHGTSYGTGIAHIQVNNLQNYNYIFSENIYSAVYHVREASGKTNSATINLYKVSSEWTHNTITYNNRPNLSSLISSVNVSSSGWYDFDVSTLVKGWLKYTRNEEGGYSQNCGFALQASDSSVSSKHFCSANYVGSYTPSLIIGYYENEVTNIGGVAGYGEVVSGNYKSYVFTVPSSSTYTIETLQPNVPNGLVRDTEIKLYNSSYEIIASNDDISSTNRYSRITTILNAGTYYLRLFNFNDNPTDLACYIIFEKNDELLFEYSDYANLTYDFKKIGSATSEYNCLAYAIGVTDQWIQTANQKLTTVTEFFEDKGYTKVSEATNNCVVAYGTTTMVQHFVKITNGIATAKLGAGELVEHSWYWAYYPQSAYGEPVAYYVKN